MLGITCCQRFQLKNGSRESVEVCGGEVKSLDYSVNLEMVRAELSLYKVLIYCIIYEKSI